MTNNHLPSDAGDDQTPASPPSRRRLLAIAAAGLGGVGLAAATGAQPATATDGQPVLLGEINGSSGRTTIQTSADGQIAIRGYNNATTDGSSVGVYGDTASPNGVGVHGVAAAVGVQGTASTGYGVYGISSDSFGVLGNGGYGGVLGIGGSPTAPDFVAAGSGMIQLQARQLTPPTSGYYYQGSLLCGPNDSGTWVCVTSGTPGAWRKIAGPGTAGALHPISPQRVYDSRHSTPLSHGQTRAVLVANGIDRTGRTTVPDVVPDGATAVALNLSVLGTTGNGTLTTWPHGLPRPLSTAMQWAAAGQALTNGFTAAVSASRMLSIYCGGTGTTHLLIDIGGYYL